MPIGEINPLSKGMVLPVRMHPIIIKTLLLDWDQMEAKVVGEGENKGLKVQLSELDDADRKGQIR